MTEILTSAEMRTLEQRAIDSGDVTGLELMERAGAAVVAAIEDHWPELAARAERGASPSRSPGYLRQDEGAPRAQVLCGPGNNGGDGFVVARLLRQLGWDVKVLATETSEKAPDAVAARAAWAGEVTTLGYRALYDAADADVYIDAIFGIGLTRGPDGELAKLLGYLNGGGGDRSFFQSRLIAIDVPSGLDADSGRVPGYPDPILGTAPVAAAALTVTFDSPKHGHVLAHGPDLCGHLAVADIGVRPFRDGRFREPGAQDKTICKARVVPGFAGVEDTFPLSDAPLRAFQRDINGHKFDHGHTLVLAGGLGRTGAARLAARGALRAGAGLVTVGAPGSAMLECATQLTAIMLRRCDGAEGLATILEDARISALCLGPGLGLARARDLVPEALRAGLPTVLDADALSCFAENPDALFEVLHEKVVLTPHAGEFARLFPEIAGRFFDPRPPAPAAGDDPAEAMVRATTFRQALEAQKPPMMSKIEATCRAAKLAGCTVLLKGADTVIADPNGNATVHLAAYERAVPQLATAGAGDVLAGFIAALLARGYPASAACESAAWLHVECARAFGPGLIAEDLPEMVPRVLRAVLDG